MKLLNLILCFSILCTIVSAQQISGRIADSEGNPLAGAGIVVKNSFLGTISDDEGKFSLRVKPGTITLEFSFIGYQSRQLTLEIKNDTDLGIIKLEKSPFISEEIIVKATRADQKSPMTYTNVGIEEIRRRNIVQDIPYILELTPSFVATSESGTGIGYTNYRIRGTDPSRINVTINGIPLNDAESQTVFWVNMPDFANSVNNIQITRGVGTSTNGAASFGGSMNFLTNNLNNNPYGEIHLTAGSFNTFKQSLLIGTGLLDNGLNFDMRLSNLYSDGYIENSFSDHQAATISSAWRGKNSLIKFNFIHGKQRTGISWWGVPKDSLLTNRTYNPAGEYWDENGNRLYYKDQTDNYIQTHYQLLLSHKFSENFDINASIFYIRGDGYYEQYKQNAKLSKYGISPIHITNPPVISGIDTIPVPDILITRTDMIHRKMMGNDFYGTNISTNYNLKKLFLTAGTGFNKYDGDHFGKIIWMKHAINIPKDYEWYRNTGIKTDFNIFAKANYQIIQNLYIYGDFQFRNINYTLDGIDYELDGNGNLRTLDQNHVYKFFNPKAGVLYDINNNSNTYISYAIAHREPTRTMFKDAAEDPSKTPLPEKLIDYEAGYNYRNRNIAANINLYYMYYKNQLIPTGEKSSVGYDIMTNVPESYRRGIEIALNYKPLSWLSIEANTTLSQNKILNFVSYVSAYDDSWNETIESQEIGTTDIAYSPNIVSAAQLNFIPISGLQLSWISKYVGSQYFDNTSSPDRKLDPYFLNNLQLSYSTNSKFIKELSFRFSVINIFNLMYSNNAYGGYWIEQGIEKTWSYYYPQAGRHYMGGVVLKF
jgi:iron complex outermembrane receptor protein